MKRLASLEWLACLEQQFALERETSHNILLHLKEIEARRLYAERGFPDLFAMLVHHFRQSETAANQRLKALKLMIDVPIVEERLISGELTLSTVAMAQRQILREEKLTGQKVAPEKKAAIVEAITGKTIAQAETELFRQLPETASHPPTVERRVSAEATRLHVTLPEDVREMMQTLRERRAHVDSTMDAVEVMRRAFKLALAKTDPTRKTQTSRTTEAVKRRPTTASNSRTHQPQELGCRTKRPTYYARELDRELWIRAGSQCEFIAPVTGRRCSCKFGLQREHVIPLALGGTNDLENMQLLCRTHNLLRARKVFGSARVDGHILRRAVGFLALG